jgi:DNA-3-methyladenine glycosylase I
LTLPASRNDSAAVAKTNPLIVGDDGRARCFWQGEAPEYRDYHDREWGRPTADDVRLYEKICLEGFQSGLSWLTVLRKRENFRRAFAGFDLRKVARFDASDVKRLLADAGIIRHRGKIESAINNAKRALDLVRETGSIASHVWRFEPSPEKRPRKIVWETLLTMPQTDESIALSKDLKKRGWSFVGPTTLYAFMQAVGIVNDHLEGCFCRLEIERERKTFHRPTGQPVSG